jgi:hypothetical protein
MATSDAAAFALALPETADSDCVPVRPPSDQVSQVPPSLAALSALGLFFSTDIDLDMDARSGIIVVVLVRDNQNVNRPGAKKEPKWKLWPDMLLTQPNRWVPWITKTVE